MAEIDDKSARLRVFALLLRYGHELFAAEDLESAAVAAVNNAHEILPFETSSIFECSGGDVRLLAQYAQPHANPHAAEAVAQRTLVENWLKGGRRGGDEGSDRIVRLPLPVRAAGSGVDFAWFVSFREAPSPAVGEVLKLIASSAGQALAYHRLSRPLRRGFFDRVGKSAFWTFVALLVAGAMFIRVPEATTSEFFVRAPEETGVYAWFDGAVAECLKKDGETVAAGEVVLRYDVSLVRYRMAVAKAQLAETEAELALTRQSSFSQPDELGRVKLLELRCEGLRVGVEEAQWYVDHAEVRAPASGIVALTEGDAARLENKAVRTGDELFRVLGGEGYEAEIPVNEREASVLRGDLEATLFLHTAPETAIPAHVTGVSRYPQMTEQKTWAYRVRAVLDAAAVPDGLRYGMRGIAKLKSGDVSLGYRMFKSAVLYLRGL